jgi:prepilin-type N-terminal cleavage/methylation domain-containing protein
VRGYAGKRSKTFHCVAGFTLLELIFAVVVIGILAALIIPRLERDIRQEAALSILNDYRTYIRNLDCNITFFFSDPDIPPLIITVTKETGYTYIADQPGS